MSTQTEETKVVHPKWERKVWYAGLSVEGNCPAAMMMGLAVDRIGNTPDHGATGVAILHDLDRGILNANALPRNLCKFREVYKEAKKGS